MVALDLSKAFDTVSHNILLQDIEDSQLPGSYKKWLCCYLQGRQTYVEFRSTCSKHRVARQGVPQGGVLSPLLFNIYMSKMPTPPPGILLVTYADDSTIVASGPTIQSILLPLNNYLDTLGQFFRTRQMSLSTAKSTSTTFTTFTKEVNETLDIFIDGQQIPTVRHPKILGVIMDGLMTFSAHVQHVKGKVSQRNNVLKALAGTTWGKSKETITTTFKAIGRSVLNYAAPIWTPTTSQSRWNELETTQNQALRTATGCHLISSRDHLHQECKMLPVRDHNILLSQQFLLQCHNPEHPNHQDVTGQPPPGRKMKDTLFSRWGKTIKEDIPQVFDHLTKKRALQSLHTKIVEKSIGQAEENPVLKKRPPDINQSEETLPRKARTTLAQLRSGQTHSKSLRSYMARIDPGVSPWCPDCGRKVPHTTSHLFNCPAKPTALKVESLWTDPTRAADFLNLQRVD